MTMLQQKNWDLRPLRKSNMQKIYCNVSHLWVIHNSIGIFFLLLVLEEYSVEVIYTSSTVQLVRLMSHCLKIETGRWSLIPRVVRVCQCNDTAIQSENHVLIECSLTQNLRLRYPDLNYRDLSSLLGESIHLLPMCKYIHEVLEFYS